MTRISSEPEEVADCIAELIENPSPPLELPSAEEEAMIELRADHDDEQWINLWSSDTSNFLPTWKALTGDDLTDLSTAPDDGSRCQL